MVAEARGAESAPGTMTKLAALNAPAWLDRREKHFTRLEGLFDGEVRNRPFLLAGTNGGSEADPYREPERWVEEAVASFADRADLLADEDVFRPLVLECWLYGVHFTDRLFGAEVFFSNDHWWSKGLRNPIGELPVPDLETNETWRQARALTDAMVDAGVSLPLICTQVLGAPLNQAFNLYKERLLMAFFDEEDGVRRDLEVVTETLCEMHRWFIGRIPALQFQPIVAAGRCQPRGYGQMCGCATHLVSPGIYDEYVAHLDDRILSLYPHGGMYHLCGAHAQHIPTWRGMQRLRALQLNDRAAEDLEAYFTGLRSDQVLYLNPTETMTAERAIGITGGRRLVLVGGQEKPFPDSMDETR